MTGYTGNYIKVYVKASGAEDTLRPGEFCRVIPEGLFGDGVIAYPAA
jgi:hypothetical protein